MLGQPLRLDVWALLLDIAEGQLGPWSAAPCGRLMMRGLVRVNDNGHVLATERGLTVLAERADGLVGCLEGSAEEAELARIADVLDACESK